VPSALPGVLVVGASDNAGSPLASSNWGALYRKDGVLAPGVRIHGAAPLNHVAQMTGTSAATAVVSGIAALLMSLQLRRERKISAPFIREAILETAARCPAHRADCDRFLAGSIDVAAATRKVEAPETPARRPNPFIPFHLAPSAGRRSPNPLQSRGIHTMSETMEELLPAATAQAASPETHASGELSAGPAEQAVTPSACGCGCKPKPLVYALGLIGYDLGSEARRDWFIQQGLRNPDNPSEMLEHLTGNPHHSMALTWTLQQETTVTYAIQPSGPFSTMAFDLLRGFLSAQVTSGVQQVSMPGIIQGDASLFNGQSVPVIHPETRGMFSWSTPALVHAVLGPAPEAAEALAKHQLQSEQVENFLERVYYEVRNFGISSSDRALNYAATNAFQVNQVFKSALELEMRLDAISVERSAICRPQSDCWDIKLMFFNPAKRLEQARLLYRFTIDVSDVVPVTVGKIRHWHVY
jgi:cyanobactin maturation PatA/PatG family protease